MDVENFCTKFDLWDFWETFQRCACDRPESERGARDKRPFGQIRASSSEGIPIIGPDMDLAQEVELEPVEPFYRGAEKMMES